MGTFLKVAYTPENPRGLSSRILRATEAGLRLYRRAPHDVESLDLGGLVGVLWSVPFIEPSSVSCFRMSGNLAGMPCSKSCRVGLESLPYHMFGKPWKGRRQPRVVERSVTLPSVNQIS